MADKTSYDYQISEPSFDSQSWEDVTFDSAEELIVTPPMTFWQDVWRRFRANKLAVGGVIVIVLIILAAIFGPYLLPYSYSDQNVSLASLPPRLELRQVGDSYIYISPAIDIFEVDGDGRILGQIESEPNLFTKAIEFEVNQKTYTIDYQEMPYSVKDEQGQVIELSKKVRNKLHLWGTDDLGRDLLTRVIYGARISLIIGFVAALVNLTVGVVYGGIAGYMGGTTDIIMMRIVEVLRSIPRLLYVIILMLIFGSGLRTVALVIGLTSWLGMAKMVRGQVLSLKENEYVLAAKAMRSKSGRIILRHLIPNAMSIIIVQAAMQIPSAIFTESSLSFVGLGVSAPQASWGTLCDNALGGLAVYPYKLFYPALAISLTVLAFNIVGDALRDSLDPKLRS